MFGEYRTKYEQLVGRKESETQRLTKLKEDVSELNSKLGVRMKAQEFLQRVAAETQSQLKVSIEPLVTTALQRITEEDIKFEMDIVMRNNSIECDLYFVKNGVRRKPKSTGGFGYINIAGLALKIVLWSLQKPRTCDTFILDEEFRDLSDAYHIAAGAMLKELSKELGIQFILITHMPAITEYADKRFRVTQSFNKKLGFPVSKIEEVV